ncbi:unnamed protein product [Arabidopsis lyrata]|nr:unnamed protein product [Arabidopsis lyrata]
MVTAGKLDGEQGRDCSSKLICQKGSCDTVKQQQIDFGKESSRICRRE